jgi:hypothetical protein
MATNSGSRQVSGVFPDLFLQNVFRPAMFACPQCGEIGKLEKDLDRYYVTAAPA